MKIEISHVSKKIDSACIISDATFTMTGGNVYGLHGINGSGKTMLMRLISGLILPTDGEIKVDGKVLGKDLEFPSETGMLLENPSFLNQYTGYMNLKLLASLRLKGNIDQICTEALNRVGLDRFDRRKYGKYSLGMKQKLGIACAIMEKPDLIILDEPFNALDDDSTLRIKKIISEERSRGALIVLTCHMEDLLYELSDEVIRIAEGKITGIEKT